MIAALVLAAALGGVVDLSGLWSFHHGDDARYADPFWEADWEKVTVPGAWPPSSGEREEIGWYRRRVPLDDLAGVPHLALDIGGIYSAFEVYADGQRIGEVGRLPPDPRIAYGTRAVFPLPPDTVADGSVLVALRVYHPAGMSERVAGPSQANVRIGPADQLAREVERADLPILILAVMFMVVAAYHLHLWIRRRHLGSYFHFGILSILTSLYVAGRTQLPADWIGWEAAKRIQLATQMLAPVAFFWFSIHFIGRPVPPWLKALVVAGVLAGMFCLFGPIVTVVQLASLQAVALFIVKLWLVYVLIRAVRQGIPESRLLAIGVLTVLLGTIHDTLVFGDVLQTPMVVPYAYAVLVGAMAISLSNRFVRVYQEVDDLNRDLERRVAERTEELAALNADLSARVRDQVAEIIRRSRLERYFSKQLLERVLSRDGDLPADAERARITVLFADLAGFTALSDRLPPETVHRLLDSYLAAMIEVVESAGATLDKLMGDGVMVMVGAPTSMPPGEQARAAVTLGIAMQHRLAALRETWRNEGIDEPLELRVGIHQDTVTVGHFGTDDLKTYTAIGKGVNLASRLEGACPPGQVLVSGQVYALLDGAFPAQGPHKLALKGIAEAVDAWGVTVDSSASGGVPDPELVGV